MNTEQRLFYVYSRKGNKRYPLKNQDKQTMYFARKKGAKVVRDTAAAEDKSKSYHVGYGPGHHKGQQEGNVCFLYIKELK